jgi:hypothetical protein
MDARDSADVYGSEYVSGVPSVGEVRSLLAENEDKDSTDYRGQELEGEMN